MTSEYKMVYQGIITIQGLDKTTKRCIYKETLKVHGTKMESLLDEMVQGSLTLLNNVFDWAATNLPSSYSPENDYWHISISFPELMKNIKIHHYETPSRFRRSKDVTNQGQIMSFADIVRFTVIVRHTTISHAASCFLLVKPELSRIKSSPRISIDKIHNAISFHEMTTCGLTGDDLLTMIRVASSEKRITRRGSLVTKNKWLTAVRKIIQSCNLS